MHPSLLIFPRHLLYALACILLLGSCASSSPRIYTTNEAQREPHTPEYYEKTHGFHPAVYLNYEAIAEHSGTSSSDWAYTRTNQSRSIILQPEVEAVSTFSLSLPPTDSLRMARIRILAPSGTAQEFTEQQLVRTTDADGSSTYKLAYPNIVRGSIVEEYTEIEDKNPTDNLPVSYSQWLVFPLPCEQLRVVYAFPSWWAVSSKRIGQGRMPNYRIERDTLHKKIAVIYTDTNIRAFPKEQYAPFRRNYAAYLSLAVDALQMGGTNYRRATSWDVYGELVRKHYVESTPFLNQVFPFLSSSTETLAHNLTDNVSTPLAKLDTIVRYLQNTIDVVPGDNQDVLDVVETRRGSPFHITGLARALLNHVDIPAQYLRIHSAEQGYFDADFISSSEIDVPALRVEIDSAIYIVFPYIKHLPIMYLPELYQGQPALLVDNNVMDTRFINVPETNATHYTNSRSTALSIGEDGSISVQETIALTGKLAFDKRTQLDGLRPEELEKVIKHSVAYNDGEVHNFQSSLENFNTPMQPLIIHATYTVDNAVVLTPDEVIVRTSGLLSPTFDYTATTDPRERVLPVQLYFNEEFTKHISISYPSSWTPTTQLRDTSISTVFGNCSLRYTHEASALHAHYNRTLMRTRQPKERYKGLIDLLETTTTEIPALVFTRRL